MDMGGRCAPAREVDHKMAVTRNWRNKISSRHIEVTVSNFIQIAELENWYTVSYVIDGAVSSWYRSPLVQSPNAETKDLCLTILKKWNI